MGIETNTPQPPSGKMTIGVALTLYAQARPDAEPTCRSILKKLYPATEGMTADACRTFFNQMQLRDLHGKLAVGEKRWASAVEADLIDRGCNSPSYLKNYPGRIIDFLAFASTFGGVERDRIDLEEGWQAYLDKAFSLLPQGRAEVRAMASAGITKLLGVYALPADDVEGFSNKVSNIRSASRRMAERASVAGLSPQEFADTVLIGPRQDELSDFTGQNIYATYCRNLWNAAALAFPELRLAVWPSRQVKVSLPVEKWPMPLREGLEEALFCAKRVRDLKVATVKTRRQAIGSYLGILDSLGVELVVVSDLQPKDALRLLTQGMPRTCLSGDAAADSPNGLVTRLMRDDAFREQVLRAMQDLEGSRDGKESVSNPYVELYMEVRLATGALAAADNLVDLMGVINRDYLSIREPHDQWLKKLLRDLDRAKEGLVTPYGSKKDVVFKHPRLWLALVGEMKAMATDLTNSPRRGSPRWATQCRDVAYCWLMLTYPLRVTNAERMQIGRNLDIKNLRLSFAAMEVKNKKAIDFELPTQGEYGEPLAAFFRLYLEEARPVLLAGADSPYVFLPDQRTPNAGQMLRRTAFNEILIALSKNKLQGVLPLDLGPLNPHLFRHIVATYQIMVNNSPVKAAQLLNDKPTTIEKHYSNILRGARQDLKAFYNDVSI